MKKIEVTVFTEGQTEEGFIKTVIAPAVRHLNIFVKPQTLRTSKTNSGGAVTYDRLKFNVRNTLLSNSTGRLTTFLDLYALDTSFPAFQSAMSQRDVFHKVEILETALLAELSQSLGFRPERFKPYIQPYEFEGLLFSDSSSLVSVESEWPRHKNDIDRVVKQFDSPEHINDGFETKPSARLGSILKPSYKKTRHGPIIAKAIGLQKMENECRHFKSWMDWLKNLASN